MESEYVTVALTGRVIGDRIVLIDSRGRSLCSINRDFACPMARDALESMRIRREWSQAICGMIGKHKNKRKRSELSCWDAKIGIWVKSLTTRRNRTRPGVTRKQHSGKERGATNWGHRFKCLEMQHLNRKRIQELRAANQWALWAETVSGNLRMRSRRKKHGGIQSLSQQEVAGRKDQTAELQMCIDW